MPIIKPEALIEEEYKVYGIAKSACTKYAEIAGAEQKKFEAAAGAASKKFEEEANAASIRLQQETAAAVKSGVPAQQAWARYNELNHTVYENKDKLVHEVWEKKDGLVHEAWVRYNEKLYAEEQQQLNLIWAKYGWSQELEDAYDKQKYEEWEAAEAAKQPKPVEKLAAKPAQKPTAKPAVRKLDLETEPQENKDVRAAIKEFTDTWYFDSEEKKALIQKDAAADKINVAISEEDQRVVAVTSSGFVTGYNKVKPHKMMTPEERSEAVKAVEHFVETHNFAQLADRQALEVFVRGANATYQAEDPVNVTAILLDNKKQALIATDTGAYEVVDVKPEAPLPAPTATTPVATGKPVKTK